MGVDLDFVSQELQIDHHFCGAVRKSHTEPRIVLDAHDIPRAMRRLRRQVTKNWTGARQTCLSVLAAQCGTAPQLELAPQFLFPCL